MSTPDADASTRLRPLSQPFVPRHQSSLPFPVAQPPTTSVPSADAYAYGFEHNSGAVAFVDAARIQELHMQVIQAEQDRHALYTVMSAAASSSRRSSLACRAPLRPAEGTQPLPMAGHSSLQTYPLDKSDAEAVAEARLAAAIAQVLSLRSDKVRGGRDRTRSAEPNGRRIDLYKTELCRSWEEKGSCRYGSRCQFGRCSSELSLAMSQSS